MNLVLREGYTTGACAAASAKAAVTVLAGMPAPADVEIPMPDGGRAVIAVERCSIAGSRATAAVIKDAGDDPDVTNGSLVEACAQWSDAEGIEFAAGEGVGTVTKKGLQIPVGEPAINPVPRRMIENAVREITKRAVKVTISIPGGDAIARNTFNPRLGVVSGLSILGTTGKVRPYSHPAIKETLRCELNVAVANGARNLVFTAGNIGTRAALEKFGVGRENVIEVSNEWGFMIDLAAQAPLEAALVAGHPGKLAKLTEGWWDTHSSRSGSAAPIVAAMAENITGRTMSDLNTVEGIFESLSPEQKKIVADELAQNVAAAISVRVQGRFPVAAALFDMKGVMLGSFGDLARWLV
ncbi:MAG: cobalamin biosynthesis protein CbiD [Nitrospinae bacterium]|nr:cobalamin biosynthesis protein CbiD [Nitrospinota bacterium]